jgi:uncharacterized heparinase superfamily protein
MRKISIYLKKARSMPLTALASKAARRVWAYAVAHAEALAWSLWRRRAREEKARRAIAEHYGSGEPLVLALRERLARRMLVSAASHREIYRAAWGKNVSHRVTVARDAEAICRHEFDLLGSGPVALGDAIPWHRDFKSGHEWPLRYHKALLVYNPWDSSDVKVPWELSRFQHLPVLGKAYWLTEDERFAVEFREQIGQWLDANPFGMGVNWKCAMDVALRAVNLVHGAGMFCGSRSMENEFWERFMVSLYLHGDHIRRNLEYHSTHRGNHYLSNIVGLIVLGEVLRETPAGKEWLEFGKRELAREMEHQVFPDGACGEMSTAYHRLVLELFWTGALAAVRGEGAAAAQPSEEREKMRHVFGEAFMTCLEKMFDFAWRTARPDGAMPMFGDHDDGRVHLLGPYGDWRRDDSRHVLAWGGRLFGRPEWEAAASAEGTEEAWWYWPASAMPTSPAAAKSPESAAYAEAGFFVLRRGDDFGVVRCGPVGLHGAGGHDHCDQLSLEISLGGVPLVVDPGCYVYTADPAARLMFRSTACHNTVRVDGEEQNRMDEINMFFMEEGTFSKALKWERGERMDVFTGVHHGYERLEKGLTHERAVVFDKARGAFLWRDVLSARARHAYEWFLHLAPDCHVMEVENGAWNVKLDGEAWTLRSAVRIEVGGKLFVLGTSLETSPSAEQGWVSRSYGTRMRAAVLRWSEERAGSVRAAFVLAPEDAWGKA